MEREVQRKESYSYCDCRLLYSSVQRTVSYLAEPPSCIFDTIPMNLTVTFSSTLLQQLIICSSIVRSNVLSLLFYYLWSHFLRGVCIYNSKIKILKAFSFYLNYVWKRRKELQRILVKKGNKFITFYKNISIKFVETPLWSAMKYIQMILCFVSDQIRPKATPFKELWLNIRKISFVGQINQKRVDYTNWAVIVLTCNFEQITIQKIWLLRFFLENSHNINFIIIEVNTTIEIS